MNSLTQTHPLTDEYLIEQYAWVDQQLTIQYYGYTDDISDYVDTLCSNKMDTLITYFKLVESSTVEAIKNYYLGRIQQCVAEMEIAKQLSSQLADARRPLFPYSQWLKWLDEMTAANDDKMDTDEAEAQAQATEAMEMSG